MHNLYVFGYSSELVLTVLLRMRVKYLGEWDLRPENFPIIILMATRTNETSGHLTGMI